jgi:Holliday junction resolvase-like predicted endonuclease
MLPIKAAKLYQTVKRSVNATKIATIIKTAKYFL